MVGNGAMNAYSSAYNPQQRGSFHVVLHSYTLLTTKWGFRLLGGIGTLLKLRRGKCDFHRALSWLAVLQSSALLSVHMVKLVVKFSSGRLYGSFCNVCQARS